MFRREAREMSISNRTLVLVRLFAMLERIVASEVLSVPWQWAPFTRMTPATDLLAGADGG